MNHRRAIFSLIAMGRITPAQAERLLAVANERAETALVISACFVAEMLIQFHGHNLLPQIEHLIRSLLPEISAAMRQIQNVVNGCLGGLL